MKKLVLPILISVALGAAGCGNDAPESGRAITPVADSADNESVVTESTTAASVVTTTIASVVTSTTRAAAAGVAPSDAVVLGCSPQGQYLTIWVSRDESEELTEVYHVDLHAAVAAVGLSGPSIACSRRGTFNQDFSLAVLTANAGGASHVVVVDLAAGGAMDLTELRQGSGFSAGTPLNEGYSLDFDSAADALVYVDAVVFSSYGSSSRPDALFRVDLMSPDIAEELPEGVDGLRNRTSASGISYYPGHGRSILSPDGRFIVRGATGATARITSVATGEVFDMPADCDGLPEGWRDASTVVVRGDPSYANDFEDNFYLVSVLDSGESSGCTAIFPPTDRDFTWSRLRLDAQALFVTVRGDSGPESYMADLSLPGAEPVSYEPMLTMDEDWRIYHPRDS